MISLAPGQDTAFLLNSLIVVIIGGMGSLGGAAIGALALGLVDAYADVYLNVRRHGPDELLDHRHLRPAGRRARRTAARALREAGMNPTVNTKRLAWPVLAAVVAVAAVAPLFVTDFFLNVILTKALWLGIAAASLIFLAAYGGMVSLAQVGIYGVAGHDLRQPRARRRRRGGGLEPVRRARRRAGRGDARRPRLRLDRVAQRGDLLPDDHARVQRAGLLLLLAGHRAVRASAASTASSCRVSIGSPETDPLPRYFVTLAVAVAGLPRARRAVADRVRARAPGRAGRAGAHARARVRRAAAPHGRVRHRGVRRRRRGRAVGLLQRPHHAGVDQPRRRRSTC